MEKTNQRAVKGNVRNSLKENENVEWEDVVERGK